MRVSMYNPARLYGFVKGETGTEVFFHLESFHSQEPGEGPPPIVGEEIQVTYCPNPDSTKAPRAHMVERVSPPCQLQGFVESFNELKSWGFIRGDDGESYHLHRSEIQDGRLPRAGRRVRFFQGHRKGRPRACYIEILDE